MTGALFSGPLVILFVCAGNTFRSVAAKHIFEMEVSRLGIASNFKVCSAGVRATLGQSAEPELDVEFRRMGYPPLNHSAAPLKKELLESSSLILTAEKTHQADIVKNFPFATAKTLTIKEMAFLINVSSTRSPRECPDLTCDIFTDETPRQRLYDFLHQINSTEMSHRTLHADIEDPFENGKHAEVAKEIRDAILTISKWWAT